VPRAGGGGGTLSVAGAAAVAAPDVAFALLAGVRAGWRDGGAVFG
jgi:hypothetical protein